MITENEVEKKVEQEIQDVANEIFSRIEKKLEEKMSHNTAIKEFLATGEDYIGYSIRIKEIQREFGFEKASTSWDVLKERAEIIVNEKLTNAGWKRNEDCLQPLKKPKEEK